MQIQQTKLNPTTEPTSNQKHHSWNSSTCHFLHLFCVVRREGCLATQWRLLFREPNDSVEVYDWLKHSVWPTSTVSQAVEASRALGGAVQDAKTYRRIPSTVRHNFNPLKVTSKTWKFHGIQPTAKVRGKTKTSKIINTVLGEAPMFWVKVYRTLFSMDSEWWATKNHGELFWDSCAPC